MKTEDMKKALKDFGVPFSEEMKKSEIQEIYEQAKADGVFELKATEDSEQAEDVAVSTESSKVEIVQMLRVVSPLMHNNVRYEAGAVVPHDLFTPSELEALKNVGTIKE